jgi:UDP-N-acetylglucosamine 2-epimerase
MGRMLVALEAAFLEVQPEAVVVYGDTNSTLAGAFTAARLGLPIAHVEAGLRSFDRRMPEEVNRVVTDHVHLVGDVMRDLAARTLEIVRDASVLAGLGDGRLRTGEYLFATVHRAENRAPDAIRGWAALFDAVARPDRPVVLALHPGTRAAMDAAGVVPGPNVTVVEPLGYRSSIAAQLHAAAVLTDSGGVQREASWLGTPCLVLRGSTEWPETIDGDGASSVLVGLDAGRALEELDRMAPPDRARADTAARARDRRIETDDATESIARPLA